MVLIYDLKVMVADCRDCGEVSRDSCGRSDTIELIQGGSKNGRRALKIFREDWYALEILRLQ